MANSLNTDLHDKVVLIKKSVLKPEFWSDRRFRVDGGFGASPDTIGTALVGQFLSDGERARMEGFDVERLHDPEVYAAWEPTDDPQCPGCSGVREGRILEHEIGCGYLLWLDTPVDWDIEAPSVEVTR